MVPVGWLLVVTGVALLGMYLRGLVGRLDRLHLRVEAAQEALDVQLLRRSSLVQELAASGWLDPASSLLLADAAAQAQHTGPDERSQAESVLTQSVRTVVEQPGVIDSVAAAPDGVELLAQLAAASERVVFARRFGNEAVRQTAEVRGRLLVRALHLAGRATLPTSFEMDDAPSSELAQFSHQRR